MKNCQLGLLGFLCILLFSTCTLINKNDIEPAKITPIPIPSDGVLLDIAYGSNQMQVMDIYFPSNPSQGNGVAIVLHGGGWLIGDKLEVADLSKWVALQGYIAIAPNYRLASYPGGPPIGQNYVINDMMLDIEMVKKVIADQESGWNCNSKKLIMIGISAGGHLALLNTLTKNTSQTIKGCISFAGPTDLTDPLFHAKTIGTFSGTEVVQFATGLSGDLTIATNDDSLKAVSPFHQISPSSVQFLLVHGTIDTIVPFSQSYKLNDALELALIKTALIEGAESGHDLSSVFGTIAADRIVPMLRQTIGNE